VEGLVDHLRDLQRVLDHERVLDDREGDPKRVGLLEPVGAEQLGAHLAGDEDDRHGVHHRVGDRGHEVGRPGPRGCERHTDLAGRLGVALGGVAATGLVAHQHMADAGVIERVVGGQVGATGEAEYDIDALGFKALHHGIDCTHRADLLSAGLGNAEMGRRTRARRSG
jgi:hypothetical protein